MTRFRRTRRTAWIALLALAALVFGPTVSRALASVAPPASAAHAHCEGMDAAEMPARAAAPHGGQQHAPHHATGTAAVESDPDADAEAEVSASAEPAAEPVPDLFESCGLCVVATLPALQAAPVVVVHGLATRSHAPRAAAPESVVARPIRSPASPRGPPPPS